MFRLAALLVGIVFASRAGVLSIEKLQPATVEAFNRYVADYEKNGGAKFRATREFLIDTHSQSKRRAFESGAAIVEVLRGENIQGGHIHHLYGAIHVKDVTARQVRATMEDYSKYTTYYKPDVAEARGESIPGGSPSEERFRVALKLVQSTLWLDVAFETTYETRYVRLDDHSFETASRSTSIREYKDAHNPSLGTYEEGNDHGFVWRIYTWWHARDRNGGVDLEVTNISLTRPVPFGFGWWASRKAKSSIENLLLRTREAVTEAPRAADSNH
jgi:hypothetical protein